MGHHQNLESYLSLSRKELQLLCKRRNLPANRTHTQLAKSLASLSEKKNSRPSPIKEKSISLVPTVKESGDILEDQSKDFLGSDGKKEDDSQLPVAGTMDHRAPDNVANVLSPDDLVRKEFDCPISKTGNNRSIAPNNVSNTMPSGAKGLTEGRFLSSSEVSKEDIPSFQFFVMAEEGINLHVDLNLSLSEWINSLKDQVSTNLKMEHAQSRIRSSHAERFPEEADARANISAFENIGRDLHGNGVNRSSDCTTSTLTSDSENCQSVAPQPDAAFVSSDSSVFTSSSIPVKIPENLDRNQVTSSCAARLSDQKHMQIDISSHPGYGNAFSGELMGASCGVGSSSAAAVDISMRTTGDMGTFSSDGTQHPEQMKCCSPKKIDDLSYSVETNAVGIALASIPKENNLLKSDGTGEVTANSQVDTLGRHNDAYKISAERQSVLGKSDVVADHDGSSNFCELGGHLLLDCSATEADSNAIPVDHLQDQLACSLASVATGPDPMLTDELGKNTQSEEKESSKCSPSQKFSERNAKRSHNSEFQEEFRNKRHHSRVENKSGMMVNLRSTRTSAKETVCEQVVRPRRSTRLLEGKLR